MNNTTVGVDLAKDIIQVCVFYQNKIIFNTEMSANEFTLWLVKLLEIKKYILTNKKLKLATIKTLDFMRLKQASTRGLGNSLIVLINQ